MTRHKDELREWAERMEGGKGDDELSALAARLEQTRFDEQAFLSIPFRRQLRRDLLARYPAIQASRRQWRLVQSLVAVGGLALIVVVSWLTMSSMQRFSLGGAPAISDDPTVSADAAESDYAYLDHALSGGVLLETVETTNGETPTTEAFLVPGAELAVAVNWSLPAGSPQLAAFAHLLDKTGATVAQSDAPLSSDNASMPQRFTSSLQLHIPESLPPDDYQLVVGLYDPAHSGRLPIVGPEGEVTQLVLGEYEVSFSDNSPFRLRLENGDALDVREVTPAAGTALSDTAPLLFSITLDHALSSLSQALLEVRVVEIGEDSGRGVGLATVDPIAQGVGRSTVEVVVNTDELLGPTELGLWLQLKPDAASAPIVIEMPDAYRWRYEP